MDQPIQIGKIKNYADLEADNRRLRAEIERLRRSVSEGESLIRQSSQAIERLTRELEGTPGAERLVIAIMQHDRAALVAAGDRGWMNWSVLHGRPCPQVVASLGFECVGCQYRREWNRLAHPEQP